jgi:23S rRNA (uridine2552-2'-O)-methyltransferase
VDLGSAPGGWSQVAGRLVGAKGKVVATDILPMEPVKNVDFILGDFTKEAVLNEILARLEGRKPDLILCDIAPNISGIDVADQAASIYLVELALDMVRQVLKTRGDFVAKVFQGAGSDAYLKELRASFQRLAIRKPAASRPRSREVYAVATGFKGAAAAKT